MPTMGFQERIKVLLELVIIQVDPTIAYILQTFADLPIHPLFDKAMWPEITDEEWIQLQPALILATYFLTCSLSLDFWHGYLYGPRSNSRDLFGESKKAFHLVYNIRKGEHIPETEAAQVHQILNELPQVIWLFLDNIKARGMHGVTASKPEWTFHGTRPGLLSNIFIDRGYLDSLRTASGPDDVLRIWMGIAISLVHEAVHGLHNAWLGAEPEQILQGGAIAEMGHAWEKHVFGEIDFDKTASNEGVRKCFRLAMRKNGVEVSAYF